MSRESSYGIGRVDSKVDQRQKRNKKQQISRSNIDARPSDRSRNDLPSREEGKIFS